MLKISEIFLSTDRQKFWVTVSHVYAFFDPLPFTIFFNRFMAFDEYFKCCARLMQWVGNFETASGTITVNREETFVSVSIALGVPAFSAGLIPSSRV